MARPIQYNPEQVLAKAVRVFWEKGYESTSVQDILDVTGLKPGSLYNIYSSKEELFHSVLESYSNHYLAHVRKLFEQGDDPIKSIEDFLTQVVIVNITDEETSGCLLIKTQLVISPKDEKIQHYIDQYFTQIEMLLKEAIIEAKKAGQTSADPEQFSKFIVTTIYGAHVFYKANGDRPVLERTLLCLIDILRNS